jgi:hypothetical protein
MASCAACRDEYERLRLTQAALLTVRDEEIPRRIAFVSDKVFEPKWYQRLWRSGPRLGFASAAMLSCAILVHAFYRPPGEVIAPPAAVAADLDARVKEEVARRVSEAVQAAVAGVEARERKRSAELLAASERKMELQHEQTMMAVDYSFKELTKRFNAVRSQLARADLGGVQ